MPTRQHRQTPCDAPTILSMPHEMRWCQHPECNYPRLNMLGHPRSTCSCPAVVLAGSLLMCLALEVPCWHTRRPLLTSIIINCCALPPHALCVWVGVAGVCLLAACCGQGVLLIMNRYSAHMRRASIGNSSSSTAAPQLCTAWLLSLIVNSSAFLLLPCYLLLHQHLNNRRRLNDEWPSIHRTP